MLYKEKNGLVLVTCLSKNMSSKRPKKTHSLYLYYKDAFLTLGAILTPLSLSLSLSFTLIQDKTHCHQKFQT